jgi:RimJ/RimL family protein N-acetyltransferase
VIRWGADVDLAASKARLTRLIILGESLPVPLGWAAVLEKATGELVGDVALQPTPFCPGDIEVGYHFARRGQHRGLATEATRALLAHAIAVGSFPRLVAAIVPGNLASWRLFCTHQR